MTIAEVFEKYRHLDHLLADAEWLPDNFEGRILRDLWLVVRAAQQAPVADALPAGAQENEVSDGSRG